MADPPVYTVTINAAPEKVWPLVADLDRHGDWSPKPYKVEWESGQPNAVGSTFKSTGWLPQDKNHEMARRGEGQRADEDLRGDDP